MSEPFVAIVMGSDSDLPVMGAAGEALAELEVQHDIRILSAHRTPDLLWEEGRRAHTEGYEVVIAGAGGAAHLPGMTASMTHLPVLGVPVRSRALSGMDSLLSIVQMPAGIPVSTFAIGRAGAINAALAAAAMLANDDDALHTRLEAFRMAQTARVLNEQSLEDLA